MGVVRSNDPKVYDVSRCSGRFTSSATRRTGRNDCNRDAPLVPVRKHFAAAPWLGGISGSPRPPKHSNGNPSESDHDTRQGSVEIPDAVQVVELIKISAFQSRNDDFGNPAPEVNQSDSEGNQPAGKEEEVYLPFLHVCSFGHGLKVLWSVFWGMRCPPNPKVSVQISAALR